MLCDFINSSFHNVLYRENSILFVFLTLHLWVFQLDLTTAVTDSFSTAAFFKVAIQSLFLLPVLPYDWFWVSDYFLVGFLKLSYSFRWPNSLSSPCTEFSVCFPAFAIHGVASGLFCILSYPRDLLCNSHAKRSSPMCWTPYREPQSYASSSRAFSLHRVLLLLLAMSLEDSQKPPFTPSPFQSSQQGGNIIFLS